MSVGRFGRGPTAGGSAVAAEVRAGLAAAQPLSPWWDDPCAPGPLPALAADIRCDLLVVGGGFTGLWTALHAARADPTMRIVLVDAQRCGWGASGRNGGFVSSSLTHGLANGRARWPDEMAALEQIGLANLRGLQTDIETHDIDCNWERTGKLAVATEPHQLGELQHTVELACQYGRKVELLPAEAVRERIRSDRFLGGTLDHEGSALVNPARLAWGLRRACLDLGIAIYEHTHIDTLTRSPDGPVVARAAYGTVTAEKVALATNAAPSLLRRLRLYTVPVGDYAILTEPLTDGQRDSIGWHGREAMTDSGNQFHYFRLTASNQLLWGGYDAVYRYGSAHGSELDQRPETFVRLLDQLVETFPGLRGIRCTHTWGGMIDTSTRFCAFFGTASRGRVGYALGYTGLGVGASRFGADVMLDLLAGGRTERTELEMVRKKPVPFPPEPLRYLGIEATRASLARADRTGGKRNLWLRSLDTFGVGFDS